MNSISKTMVGRTMMNKPIWDVADIDDEEYRTFCAADHIGASAAHELLLERYMPGTREFLWHEWLRNMHFFRAQAILLSCNHEVIRRITESDDFPDEYDKMFASCDCYLVMSYEGLLIFDERGAFKEFHKNVTLERSKIYARVL